MRGWASLFRRGGKPAPELYGPLEEATQPPPSPEPPAVEPPPAVVSSPTSVSPSALVSPPTPQPSSSAVSSPTSVPPPDVESPPTSVPPPIEAPAPIEAVALAPEEGARELVFAIMRAAPDVRYRAARALGLLEGQGSGGGPEFERRLLERARDARQLAALERALQR
jgi:hypothetical protein